MIHSHLTFLFFFLFFSFVKQIQAHQATSRSATINIRPTYQHDRHLHVTELDKCNHHNETRGETLLVVRLRAG